MQSIFRRAWQPDPTDKKTEKALLPKQIIRPPSLVDIPSLIRMKRKRSQSPDNGFSTEQEKMKKRKTSEQEEGVQLPAVGKKTDVFASLECSVEEEDRLSANIVPALNHVSTPVPAPSSHALSRTGTATDHVNVGSYAKVGVEQDSPTAKDDVKATSDMEHSELRDVIEHQVNLEILLKHRELRLIEQELAKCQVALEQLRRCEIVPFPGFNGLDEAISTGSGPSLKAPLGHAQPQAPAPWGVTDGPYTRHYSKWLLNDPAFDTMPPQQTQLPADYFSTLPEGRATRNSGAGMGRASKSRPSRDSVGNFSHALPNYPMNSRGKGGPLVIKRMADNQFVKLICNNCQRGDFSSVQGFLNHCRIAHKVDYKSHEAAATDCGRPLEDDEAHLVPPATPAAVTTVKTPGSKVIAPVTQLPPSGSVHPLNAPTMPQYTWKVQAAAARVAATTSKSSSSLPSTSSREPKVSNGTANTPAAESFFTTPLVTSSNAPYLSTQFAKRGFGGDLKNVIARAREQIDLGPEPTDDDEPSSATPREQSNSRSAPGISASRFASPAGAAIPGHSQSRKGQQMSMSRPRPAPLASSAVDTPFLRGEVTEIPESPLESTLSPHTADSNPGLVSDHEDDDVASELDEVRSERHASSDPPLTQLGGMRRGITACGPDVEIEFEDDGEGHHGVLIRPRDRAYQEFTQRPSGNSSQRPVGRFGEPAK